MMARGRFKAKRPLARTFVDPWHEHIQAYYPSDEGLKEFDRLALHLIPLRSRLQL